MGKYTFEYRENDAAYEIFEWDRIWIDHANDRDSKIRFVAVPVIASLSGIQRNIHQRERHLNLLMPRLPIGRVSWQEPVQLFRMQV